MVERIPQHRHCAYCDKAISPDKQFCNEECESHQKAKMKAKKKQLQIFYVVMLVIFMLALLISFR